MSAAYRLLAEISALLHSECGANNDGGLIMSATTLLVILLVGLIAGWLAGQIVKGTGFGLVADIAIGIVGALIGSWLLPRLGIHLGSGIIPAIPGLASARAH